jgi:primosomal replication protein N
VLSGRLAHIEPLRHTPAGVPVIEFRITHSSRQIEAGAERAVECEMDGVGLGETARKLAELAPGAAVTVTGFIARRSVRSNWPVLHATAAETARD